jgi:hypothetical protein
MKKLRIFLAIAVLTLALTAAAPSGRARLVATAGGNQLTNGSFEADVDHNTLPDGWKNQSLYLGTDGMDNNNAKAGSFSMKMVGLGNVKKYTRQNLFVEGYPGDQWSLSVWGAGDGVPTLSSFRVQVQFFSTAEAAASTLVANYSYYFPVGTYGFQNLSLNMTVPDYYQRVQVTFSYKADSGQVWFDNARLVFTPAP